VTSCDYCERKEPEHIIWWCVECNARVCTNHSSTLLPKMFLCDPPKDGPQQQRGCYKPPVAEVACVACDKPTSDLHADVPIHVGCRYA